MPPKKASAKGGAKANAAASEAPTKQKFSFKKIKKVVSSAEWKAGHRRASSKKVSSATFALVAAKFQKGDKQGELTGAIYFRGVPLYGQNDKFKTEVHKSTLAESLRWNDELKVYTCKVYTAKQARKILSAMKSLDGCAKSLPEDVEESVFDDAKPAEIQLVLNLDVEGDSEEGEMMVGVTGTTYPFKEELKAKGFRFHDTVNGEENVQMWLAPQDDVDTDELTALFEEYGFAVEQFDGVDDDE